MLVFRSMLLPCHYAQNNASIMSQSLSQRLLASDQAPQWRKRPKNGVKLVAWGGGKGGGAWRHAFGSAVPWYQILVSCSDWVNWLLQTFTQFWLDKPNKTDYKFNRNTLRLNSLLHKVLNLHIVPPRNILTLPISRFRQVHYEKPCYRALWRKLRTWGISAWESIRLIFTGRMPRIFLWNVLISLRRSWCYFSWRSMLSRSLCLHSFHLEFKYLHTKATY